MNPEILNTISLVCLTAGFVFLMITLILCWKYNIISLIKSEINQRKESKFSADKDYFEYVENKNNETADIENLNISHTVPSANRQIYQNTTGTVIAGSAERKSSSTVLVMNKTNSEETEKFVVIENIMIINGNPAVIKSNKN